MGTRRRQRPAQQPPQSQSPRAGLAACDVQMGTKLVVPKQSAKPIDLGLCLVWLAQGDAHPAYGQIADCYEAAG